MRWYLRSQTSEKIRLVALDDAKKTFEALCTQICRYLRSQSSDLWSGLSFEAVCCTIVYRANCCPVEWEYSTDTKLLFRIRLLTGFRFRSALKTRGKKVVHCRRERRRYRRDVAQARRVWPRPWLAVQYHWLLLFSSLRFTFLRPGRRHQSNQTRLCKQLWHSR